MRSYSNLAYSASGRHLDVVSNAGGKIVVRGEITAQASGRFEGVSVESVAARVKTYLEHWRGKFAPGVGDVQDIVIEGVQPLNGLLSAAPGAVVTFTATGRA